MSRKKRLKWHNLTSTFMSTYSQFEDVFYSPSVNSDMPCQGLKLQEISHGMNEREACRIRRPLAYVGNFFL